MNILLKKIEIVSRMSEETTCFTADLWIEGKHVGTAKNGGTGGPTHYSGFGLENIEIIRNAEAYCLSLPAQEYDDFSIPMTLELFIDNIIDAEVFKKETAKLQAKIQKDCLKAICWGNKEAIEKGEVSTSYSMLKWRLPIAEILNDIGGRDKVKQAIADVKKQMKEGESILNTNLPADLLN